jgi:hypothetical protein
MRRLGGSGILILTVQEDLARVHDVGGIEQSLDLLQPDLGDGSDNRASR